MSVYAKLMQARIKLQNSKLSKSGKNSFAGYQYFELGDFIPRTMEIFAELGLCGTVSYDANLATLTIISYNPETLQTYSAEPLLITSPMSSAALKGCHDVQNLGAVQSYLRRYLWVTAMEIVEHDALDATTGKDTKSPVRPNSIGEDYWNNAEEDVRAFLNQNLSGIRDHLANNDPIKAQAAFYDSNLDEVEKAAVWAQLSKAEHKLISRKEK